MELQESAARLKIRALISLKGMDMGKEQRSVKEKKKPKQDKNAKAAKPLTAYAASKAGKK